MPYYRLYHIKDAHFARVDDYEAEDDEQAIRHAETLGDAGAVELWSGTRRIELTRPRGEQSGRSSEN